MTYSPLNINVYTAAFAGAVAGTGIPTGAFITDPVSDDYALPISVATVFAQAVDTAWGANSANTYDIEAITDAADNLFARGAGWPIEGAVITQANWTIVAVALVAMIRKGDSTATAGGIVFPPLGGTGPSFTITQELWVAATWGSDTTGDGSIFNPFQTILHAQSVITDASASKIYEIILYPGEYTEDVAIKAFTKIVGFDPTQSALNSTYPANLSGNISLGTSFLGANQVAWITNCELSGNTVDIDFTGSSSTISNSFSFTNCQLTTGLSVIMASSDNVELHGCTLIGEYLQKGGGAIWENVAGVNSGAPLSVWAGTDSGATLQMFNSTWEGDINADQRGNVNAGETVNIIMENSQARSGICTIVAAGANVPTIDGTYGALPENPVLQGSTTVQLSRQMRVSIGLSVPSGTVLPALGTVDVVFPLLTSILGSSNIEQMSCTVTPQGAVWGTQVVGAKCIWSSYVVQNGTTSEVHIVFDNPNDSPVTLTAALPFLFYAFLPNNINSPTPHPTAIPLLTAANYEVLAKSGITNIDTSHITGAMGVSPIAATAITGFALTLDGSGQFSTSAQVTGHVYAASYTAPTPATLTQAVLDMQAAYTNAASRTPDFVEFDAGLLNGDVLSPGVYRWSTAVAISGSITLAGNASSVFIFQIAGALTLAAAQSIILSGGVLASNVFWQVATNTAIGAAATFNGIILGFTDITLGAGATLHGKCLSQTAVNFNSDTLN